MGELFAFGRRRRLGRDGEGDQRFPGGRHFLFFPEQLTQLGEQGIEARYRLSRNDHGEGALAGWDWLTSGRRIEQSTAGLLDPLADPFLSDCHIPSPKGHNAEGLRRRRRRRSRERLGRFLGRARRDRPGLRLRKWGGWEDGLSAVCGGTGGWWGGSGKFLGRRQFVGPHPD